MMSYHTTITFLIIHRDTKIKMTPSCSARQDRSKNLLFNLKRSISKFDLRSGQVQVMVHVGHYVYWISSEPSWRAKTFGTICAPLPPSCHELLTKRGLWPHATSDDLSVTLDHQLHSDHHRCGEWPWPWNDLVVSIGLCETGCIFIFPHRLVMGRSRNWPNIRLPAKNPRSSCYR